MLNAIASGDICLGATDFLRPTRRKVLVFQSCLRDGKKYFRLG